jgi:hypothetical protein
MFMLCMVVSGSPTFAFYKNYVSYNCEQRSSFTTGERAPGTYWLGGWVGPRASLDDVEKKQFLTLPELELRPLGHPARGPSVYRLRYLGFSLNL